MHPLSLMILYLQPLWCCSLKLVRMAEVLGEQFVPIDQYGCSSAILAGATELLDKFLIGFHGLTYMGLTTSAEEEVWPRSIAAFNVQSSNVPSVPQKGGIMCRGTEVRWLSSL
jgi:hypothetical protein